MFKTYLKIDFDDTQKILKNVIALTYKEIKKSDKYALLDEVKNLIYKADVIVEVEQR